MAKTVNFDKKKSKRKHGDTDVAGDLLLRTDDSCVKKQKKLRKQQNKHANSSDSEHSEGLIETGIDENRLKKKKKREKKSESGYDDLSSGEGSPDDCEQVTGVSERDDGVKKTVPTVVNEDNDNEGHINEVADLIEKDMDMKKNDKLKKKKKRDRWGQIINDENETNEPAYESVHRDNQGSANGADGSSFSQNDLYNETTIAVGGMPYDTTEEDIMNVFGECGTIDKLICARFTDTDRFKGFAYITFKEEAAVKKALGLDGSQMGKRCIKVDRVKKEEIMAKKGQKGFMEPPKREDGSLSVYIGNLDWNMQKIDIKRFFKGCAIDDVRLAMDRSSGKFLGYGHVDFSDDESLEKAVKMNQQLLFGRPVRVSYAVSKGSKRR